MSMEKNLLNNEQIGAACDAVEEFLSGVKMDSKDALRTRLAVEETLLNYQQCLGQDAAFSFKCTKRLGRPRIELSFPGERADPFATDEEASSEVMRGIMAGMGFAPLWEYKNGLNLVIFTPRKKKPSQFLLLIIALALAVVCGLACQLLPAAARIFLAEDLIGPIFNMFMGLISAVAGPMIFLSVTWGIFSIGDTATLGRIGKRMVGRFLIISALLGLITAVLYLPFFHVEASGTGGEFQFRELFQMILDIVPGNFFTPFTEGNPIQIIFVAVLIGVALLILGTKTSVAASLVEQLNYVVQLIMEGISSFVPVFVFCSIFNIILQGDWDVFRSAYKLVPVMLLGCVVISAIYLAVVSIRRKVNVALLIKKILPAFLIGLTTDSSSAAFSTNVESCEKDLGISKKIVNFGVPLGQVIFKPAAIVLFLSVSLCMAESYDVPITINWIVSAVLITVILASAAPPVPGGALTCYTVMFLQLGIPAEALAVAIALNMILEFAATAVNMLCLQTELVELAGGLDMLNKDALRQSKRREDK